MASYPVRHARSANYVAIKHAVDALQSDFSSNAAYMAVDGKARATYDQLIRRYAAGTRAAAERAALSWDDAAARASSTRNSVMTRLCWRGTPVGGAPAESIKKVGEPPNQLIGNYTAERLGLGADFNRPTVAQRKVVYGEVVDAPGRSSRYWTPLMRKVSLAGRAILVVSPAISIYDIANAKEHMVEAKHQGALSGTSVAGSAAAALCVDLFVFNQ